MVTSTYVHLMREVTCLRLGERWKVQAGCVCHRENNCLGSALSSLGIASVLKKLKGVCTNVYRSDKVSFKMLYISCL